MAKATVERKIAAILAADVVGFSRMTESDEVGTLDLLKRLRAGVIDPLIAEHRGRIIKLMGDGMLVEFASVVEAVECAAAVQKKLRRVQADSPPQRTMQMRIGLHLGDVIVDGDDLLGDGVNIAARLEPLCEAGGVLMSGAVYDQLPGKVDLKIESAGKQRVKNIARRIQTYRIRADRRTPSRAARERPAPVETPPEAVHRRPRGGSGVRRSVAVLAVLVASALGLALYDAATRHAPMDAESPPQSPPSATPPDGNPAPSEKSKSPPLTSPVEASPPPISTPDSVPAPAPTTPPPSPAPQPEPVPPPPKPRPAPPEVPPKAAAQPRPPVAPLARFGAIAVSSDLPRKKGYSEQATLSEAKADALRRCAAAGGQECAIAAAFTSCGAVASGNSGWGAGQQGPRQAVEAGAVAACGRSTHGCRLLESRCVGQTPQQ